MLLLLASDIGAPHIPPSPGKIASGDLVRVVLDLETFKHKQLKPVLNGRIKWQRYKI